MPGTRPSSRKIVPGFFAHVALAATACGGGDRPAVIPSPAGADASVEGSTSPFATTAAPSGLPPMAPMPAPGVAGSKKAKRRADAGLAGCGSAVPTSVKDPIEHVKRIGERCAAPSKMKASAPPIRGQQADKDAHAEHKFRAEANKCYRVYVATDEGARDVVAVVRDSAGDIVAESNGAVAVPADGAMCFTTADEVTLLVSVGSGRGTYAAQVWSD